MKKVSQAELDKLRRKKGVKVKRKLGTKKPEPEVKEPAAESGAVETATPAPALPPTILAAPQTDMKPYAAMSASIAASNANVAKLIENNTKVIEDFKAQLAEKAGETKKRVSWKHKIKRDGFKLMEEIISSPIE
jgi:hypothetical protein